MTARLSFNFCVRTLAAISFFVLSSVSHAQADQGKFGYEYTFSFADREQRMALMSSAQMMLMDLREVRPDAIEFWNVLYQAYVQKCKFIGCRSIYRKSQQNFQFELKDGTQVEFKRDFRVIEVIWNPVTLAEQKQLEPFIQENLHQYLFDIFELMPMPSLGGGHVSMDVISHFGYDLNALINFIEDTLLNSDVYNESFRQPRPSTRPFSPETYERLKKVLRNFREAANRRHPANMATLMNTFHEKLEAVIGLKGSPIFFHFSGRPHTWRIEFRTPKPQACAEDGRLFAEILTLRRDYLRQNPPSRVEGETAAKRFMNFVSQSGGMPARYVSLLEINCNDILKSSSDSSNAHADDSH